MNNQMYSWSKSRLFKNFSDEELKIIHNYSREKKTGQGEYLIQEGERGGEIYIIEEGNAEILKNDIDKREYQINTLAQGQVFGEMILFEKSLHTTSVRSTQPVIVREISVTALESEHPAIFSKILKNFSLYFAARLEETNLMSIFALKKMSTQKQKLYSMSRLMIQIFVFLSVYQLIMRVFIKYTKVVALHATTLVDMPMIILVAIISFLSIRKQGSPLSICGLTLRNWKKSIIESVLLTIPLMLFIVIVKWILVETVPNLEGVPVFQEQYGVKSSFFHREPLSFAKASIFLYLVSAPFQEFIFRGIIQTSLQRVFIGRRRVISAILVSNLAFAAAHEPLSWVYPLLVFLPGIFWGWLYMRQRTLIGVSVSHVILGVWVLHFVGVGL